MSYYGVYVPPSVEADNLETRVFTDRESALDLLKRFKPASRFKICQSQKEAENFAYNEQVETKSLDVPDSPRPSESSSHKSLTPQEEVKLRKAIESTPSDIGYIQECVLRNPRYLVTGNDTPVILHQGQRHNALHVCAKNGKEEAARQILSWIISGELMRKMYPDEALAMSQKRSARLTDLYINMPDKGGGDTPLHLAVKFGRVGMVRILASFSQTNMEATNKFGELPKDIISSRRETTDDVKNEIRDILRGEFAIPVYNNEEGMKTLGRPVSWKEANDVLESSGGSDSPMMSTNSPLSNSPFKSIASPIRSSPRCSVSSRSSTETSPLISAVLGPINENKAEKLYHSWRKESRERIEDPSMGAERQGRQLAKKEDLGWLEYWDWLGEYVDITTVEGLTKLENHLDSVIHQQERLREVMDEDGEDELDNGNEYDNVFNENNQMEELELMSNSSPQTQSLNDLQNQPGSPLSSLTRELNDLNLMNGGSNISNNQDWNKSNQEKTENNNSSLANEVMSTLAQFAHIIASNLIEALPDGDPEALEINDVADWATVMMPHWRALRRQVNNWRSDPKERYDGLMFDQVAGWMLKYLLEEFQMELDDLSLSRVFGMMDKLSGIDTSKKTGKYILNGTGDNFSQTREVSRHNSLEDFSYLSDIQTLATLTSEYHRTGQLPPSNKLLSLWNVTTTKKAVQTSRINTARKFLHSTDSEPSQEDFSIINLQLTDTDSRKRKYSENNVVDDEGFQTPPSSPTMSIISQVSSMASMATCDEGRMIYLHGNHPTQADRRVAEATAELELENLKNFPSVSWYLANLRSIELSTMKQWPTEEVSTSNDVIRRLDMDVTF